MATFDIDIERIYKPNQNHKVIYYKDKILIIMPLSANWIVLENKEQLDIFDFLVSGKTIKETLENEHFSPNHVTYVISQIEARRLFSKKTHKCTIEGRSLHIYLTNKCNLLCPHCYMFSGKANENEISTEEVISLLKDYKEIAKGTNVTFSGGEPSTRIDFETILKTSYELGLKVKVLTNGVLMTPSFIEKIAKYISSVQISIDGYSEESNAVIRGKGHFQKAVGAVECFISHGIETSIAITPSLESLRENSSQFVKFAQDLMGKYDEHLEIKFAEGLINGRKISPTLSYNTQYAEEINSIQKAIYGEQYNLMTFVDLMNKDVILNNCMFGSLAVSSVGDVYLCSEIDSLVPIANIRTSKFSDFYEKSKIAEVATEISRLQPCKECELMYICGGGCRTKEFGSLCKRTSFENLDYDSILPRHCNSNIKERFYQLMIDSNDYLYVQE